MMMIRVSLGSVLYQRATRTMAQMRLTADTLIHPSAQDKWNARRGWGVGYFHHPLFHPRTHSGTSHNPRAPAHCGRRSNDSRRWGGGGGEEFIPKPLTCLDCRQRTSEILFFLHKSCFIYCISWDGIYTPQKSFFDIPVPSRDVTYQTLPRRHYSRPGRVW
jgi:hypothetical protein